MLSFVHSVSGFRLCLNLKAIDDVQWKISTVVFWCNKLCVYAKSLQSCLTLCDPLACSPPGSSVHGILQARILEWVAMPSSRRSFGPRAGTHVSCISCFVRPVLYHQCGGGGMLYPHSLRATSFQEPLKASSGSILRIMEN